MKKEKFYSNCLFTAIGAKIKDPKNIKIILLPKKITKVSNHFVWWDKKNNTVSHFSQTKIYNLKNPLNRLRQVFFEGRIKTISKDTYDKYISVKLLRYENEKIKKLEEKMKISDFTSKSHWKEFYNNPPSYEDGLPLTERVPYAICQFVTKDGGYDFKAVRLEKGKAPKLPENLLCYKYPSIADKDFGLLWGNYKDYFKLESDFE